MSRRAACAAAAVLLLGGCESAPPGAAAPGPGATAAVSGDFNAVDVQFVQRLVPHHREGIEIARLGAERARRPEIRTLASAIVATQQDEVARLTGWLGAWRQPSPSSAPAGKRLAALRRSTDAAFEQEFLALLSDHQGAAIALAKAETEGGRNRDALALARQIELSRAAEIQQLRGWLSAS